MQNKWKGCIAFIWEACFFLQCYTNISPLFSEVLLFVKWCKHLESRSPNSSECSFSYCLPLSYAYKRRQTIGTEISWHWNWVQRPFCSLSLCHEVLFHGAELNHPSNHTVRAGHSFCCCLPASLVSTWLRAWAVSGRVSGKPQLPPPLQSHTWAVAGPYLAE